MYAVINNKLQIADYLLSEGADSLAYDEKLRTPLFHAVLNNNLDMVKLLLKKGDRKSIYMENQEGMTPLMYAVKEGYAYMDIIKELTKEGPLLLNAFDEEHYTPLTQAIINEDYNIADYLTSQGADPVLVLKSLLEGDEPIIKDFSYPMMSYLLNKVQNPREYLLEGISSFYYQNNKQNFYPLLVQYSVPPSPEDAYLNPLLDYPRYPLTQRPVTALSFAGNVCRHGNYLPVSRYKIYYSVQKTEQNFCGTFYFFEPNSSAMLNLGRTLVVATKHDALLQLAPSTRDFLTYLQNNILVVEPFTRGLLNFARWSTQREPIVNLLNYYNFLIDNADPLVGIKDIQLSQPLESLDLKVFELFIKMLTTLAYDDNDLNSMRYGFMLNMAYKNDKDTYMGGENGYGFYSQYDYADQVICSLARAQGYDTVILQREPGHETIVSEILDTRTREESYNSICRLGENARLVSKVSQSQYPKVWFPSYGYIKI
jgi:hypothetical protein